MAGIAPSPSGKRGRRTLDVPVNLVPYIDLMVTIITFLMMTAVWTQVSALEMQNSANSAVTDKKNIETLTIEITNTGFLVLEEGSSIQIPKNDGYYDMEKLSEILKKWKEMNIQNYQIDLLSEDGILYDSIAKIIDIAAGLKLTDVTLKPIS